MLRHRGTYCTINQGLSFFVSCVLLGGGHVFGQGHPQSLDLQISYPPVIVLIDAKPTVYYELHLTNLLSDSLTLTKLDIIETGELEVLASIKGKDLQSRYAVGGFKTRKDTLLLPGASAVIYVELILPQDKANIQFTHRLEFDKLHPHGRNAAFVQSATQNTSRRDPLVLGPPLNNGPWVAVYDPSWEQGHRRVFYTVNKEAHIPGRFAIDFIKVDDQGKFAGGDENIVKNWLGYDSDVLAVADGTIASIQNDFPESATLSDHPAYTPDKATGNYISIDIGNNRFAFYEHLKPGSINVRPGQKVKKGDVIASLGFTGQSNGPHLHFHVANMNSPLAAEGIPFVFERFTLLGSYVDFENFGKTRWHSTKDSSRQVIIEERPAPNAVVRFHTLR